jgi:hypothetical protein
VRPTKNPRLQSSQRLKKTQSIPNVNVHRPGGRDAGVA